MKVVVAGATGVLGRAVVPLLLQNGHTVRALVRSSSKARALLSPDVENIEYDLLSAVDEPRLPALLRNHDAVMHIATAIPRDAAAPGAWDANTRLRVEGTRRLLDAALAVDVGQYIQQSIVMAYPDRGEEWITEDVPLDTTPRRAAINAPVITMEHMLRAIAPQQLCWCILRGGSFVGKDTFQDDTIANLRSGQQLVAGDGRNFMSLVHVADMAAAVIAVLAHRPAGSIFNIVAEPLRQGDYLDQLAMRIGAARPARDPGRPLPPSWRCSNMAAQTLLQWTPAYSVFPEETAI